MNAIATKLRKKPENLRMLKLLVRRDVAEGLYQLAKEAKVLPEALVSQWVEGKLPPQGTPHPSWCPKGTGGRSAAQRQAVTPRGIRSIEVKTTPGSNLGLSLVPC